MDKGEVTLLTSYKWHQGLADVIWSGQGRAGVKESDSHTKTMSKHLITGANLSDITQHAIKLK